MFSFWQNCGKTLCVAQSATQEQTVGVRVIGYGYEDAYGIGMGLVWSSVMEIIGFEWMHSLYYYVQPECWRSYGGILFGKSVQFPMKFCTLPPLCCTVGGVDFAVATDFITAFMPACTVRAHGKNTHFWGMLPISPPFHQIAWCHYPRIHLSWVRTCTGLEFRRPTVGSRGACGASGAAYWLSALVLRTRHITGTSQRSNKAREYSDPAKIWTSSRNRIFNFRFLTFDSIRGDSLLYCFVWHTKTTSMRGAIVKQPKCDYS